MIRPVLLATALVALVACPRPGRPRPVAALAGPARVAVVPFRTGPGSEAGAGTEAVPADAGPAAARMAAFMPGASPPLVRMPIRRIGL